MGKLNKNVPSVTQVDLVLSGRTNTPCFLLCRCIWRSFDIFGGLL